MNSWRLPVTVTVAGRSFAIRSDFRAVLDAMAALRDDDLSPQDQRLACLMILYPRYAELPDLAKAFTSAMEFINLGRPVNDSPGPLPGGAPGPDLLRKRGITP